MCIRDRDNAVVKAVDAFRSIESLPFARESSDLFDRPSISLGRIVGGDAVNRVPDSCTIDLDIRYLPGQDPDDIIAAVAEQRGSDYLVQQGYLGDFAITGEPTDMHIGIQAKGVLAMRIEVTGKAAHGSTPWEGDNAVLKAIDVFRQIEVLPFARESSDLFDRPSINLGRIVGGDALNKVPDLCGIDVDVRYLPGQDVDEIRAAVDALPDARVVKVFHRRPAIVDRDNPYVQALGEAISRVAPPVGEQISVGRDGASDAISFLEAGVPAVECGPTGAGHHGPDEWVSVRSLGEYRRALVEFVNLLPARLGKDERPLRIA